MKKTLLAALLTIASAGAYAGGHMEHESGHQGKNADHMIESLDLDEGRAEEVRAIMQEAHEARKNLREKMHQERRQIHEQTQEKLRAVLTPEEMDQLEENMESAREQHKDKEKKKNKDKKHGDH